MDLKTTRSVRVRVNALGNRVTGEINVPPPHFRVSDYLNSHEDFLRVFSEGAEHLIAKDTISYLEAMEEGEDKGSRPSQGMFQPVTIVLREHVGTLTGELFIAEGGSLQAALNRARRFLNVRAVKFVDSPETYDFLAIGKQEFVIVRGTAGK